MAKTKKQKSKKVPIPNSDSDSDSDGLSGIEPFKDGEGISTKVKKKYVDSTIINLIQMSQIPCFFNYLTL